MKVIEMILSRRRILSVAGSLILLLSGCYDESGTGQVNHELREKNSKICILSALQPDNIEDRVRGARILRELFHEATLMRVDEKDAQRISERWLKLRDWCWVACRECERLTISDSIDVNALIENLLASEYHAGNLNQRQVEEAYRVIQPVLTHSLRPVPDVLLELIGEDT